LAQAIVSLGSGFPEVRCELVKCGFETISLVLVSLHATLEALNCLILRGQSLGIVLRPLGVITILRLHDQKLISEPSVL
jgi:hypothetical protein